jgi:hypothetical protein
MQASTSISAESNYGNKYAKEAVKRLTPADYSKAGILKAYDWSVKEREAHDKEMAKYRLYLMKLCILSHKLETTSQKDE